MASGEEGTPKVLLLEARRLDPGEHLRGRTSTLLAMPVGVLLLDVVVAHPPILFLEEPGPILCSGGVVVGHPPLNAPGGFEITLPGLALLDLQLADAKRPVDGLSPSPQS